MEKVNFWQRNFVEPLKWVFSRFPLSIAVFTILAGILSYLVIAEIEPENNLFVFLFTIGLSGILFATARLFQEKFAPKNTTWIYGVILAYLIAFYFFGTMFWERNFPLFLLQTLAFVGFPFWISENWREKTDFRYYNFFRSALTAVTLGAGVAIIMGFLGTIAIFAIKELFDLGYDFQGKTTAIWWIFSIVIFGTTYTLSRFPIFSLTEAKKFDIDATSNFVIKFIFVPFSIIYFVILYAYSVKVLANFSDWPKGIIASLVMGFSILGYFTYMLSQSIENNFIKNFRKILPWAVFFQLFMLFYAIWLRIDQYGLTTNRYIIVLSGATLAVTSLYFIISKSRKIAIIPASFSLVALLFSVGPWNIQSLPEKLQFEDFMKKAQEYQIFDGEKFIKNTNLTSHQQYEIRDKIYYLCPSDNNCALEKLLPKEAKIDKYQSNYEKQNELFKMIGLDTFSTDHWPLQTEKIFNFVTIDKDKNISIKNFDYLVDFADNKFHSEYSFVQNENIWTIKKGDTIIFEKDFSEKVQEFYEKYKNLHKQDYYEYFHIDDAIVTEFENENFVSRIIFHNFKIRKIDENISIDFSDKPSITMLIKDKNNLLDAEK